MYMMPNTQNQQLSEVYFGSSVHDTYNMQSNYTSFDNSSGLSYPYFYIYYPNQANQYIQQNYQQ